MFFVINKEKVYAYIVSILTIVTLFFVSNMLNSDISTSEQTSGNLEQNQINVDTDNNIVQNINVENNTNR